MGFMRKNAIFWTGGAARLVINPNSKKARTAKATEQMLKLQKAEAKRARSAPPAARVELGTGQVCDMCGKPGHGPNYHAPETHRPPQTAALAAARPTASPTREADPALAAIDQLTQLGKLREAGVLTDEEFAVKKAQILDRI
ncbi:hypothetical protein GCM10027076_31430 [Nocardioides montaniterrae]